MRWRSQRGFTLVELMIVVAVIGVLATIAVPLYTNMMGRARIAKAQADLRAIASAATIYQAHMGSIPAAVTDLTQTTTNAQNLTAGPFLGSVPAPPATWSYANLYSVNPDGTFTLTASGDGTVLTFP